ncbi:MAG: hypothetical protein RL678_324 [Pseudomonadota bacterium]|jgi:Flp pilus assembly protein TadG
MMISRRKISVKKISGGVVVEFAIVLPILLTLIFGIVEFSVVLFNKAVITNAAREAARAGIVLKSPKLTTGQISSVATAYTGANLITFGTASPPTVTVTGAAGSFGTKLTVKVDYIYRGLGLGSLLSSITSPMTLTASAAMSHE